MLLEEPITISFTPNHAVKSEKSIFLRLLLLIELFVINLSVID